MYSDEKIELYKLAVDARKLEIQNFWTRSLFFWGFIAAAYLAYVSAKDAPILQALLAHFGLMASCSWYLINRGGKYWQEIWELKVEKLEKGEETQLFSTLEPVSIHPLSSGKFSVSRVTTLFRLVTVFAWLGLVVRSYLLSSQKCLLLWASLPTLAVLVVLFTLCRSSGDRKTLSA
jgi:hypothetical protein